MTEFERELVWRRIEFWRRHKEKDAAKVKRRVDEGAHPKLVEWARMALSGSSKALREAEREYVRTATQGDLFQGGS